MWPFPVVAGPFAVQAPPAAGALRVSVASTHAPHGQDWSAWCLLHAGTTDPPPRLAGRLRAVQQTAAPGPAVQVPP
ncbi:hypothetical protein, partial [Streptococcus intermedius]|uniref:hypothetical protein n=1 Tax=Streptococcus intermedius TaxID=1338 RepID=UPI0013A5F9C0